MSDKMEFLYRLADIRERDLEVVLSYVTAEDCVEDLADLEAGDCGCVVCLARRLYAAIWPPHPTVREAIVRDVLDFADDARVVYRPEAVVELGISPETVAGLTYLWDDLRGVIGLDLIRWLAEAVGADLGDVPCLGWQRTMRAYKRAIRAKVGLPAVAGEDN